MTSIVLQLSEREKNQVKASFAKDAQPSKNPYVEAFFKPEGATITIYSSGKVMFQGERAERKKKIRQSARIRNLQ